ncbi:hypothetical protein GCM10027446_30200 [Angustibacter peucedani]
MPDRLEVVALPGVPEVSAGTDLAAVLLAAVTAAGRSLETGDVLVVSSKVVSKALGLVAETADRDAVVAEQTVRVVAERRTPRGLSQVVESAAGPVMAAAGVDASNTAPGTVLTLPADPDAEARALRRALRAAGAPVVAVVVSDTAGRAWRRGQSDLALGCAGLDVVEDLRGTTDASGQVLEVTERAVADEVAAAADLVKGKASGIPAALVRGLASSVTDDDGPGAQELLRDSGSDWFRLGPVEAVRAALGVSAGEVEPASVLPEPLRHRAVRATQVAGAGELVGGADDSAAVVLVVREPDAFERGRLVQRLLVALWAEDLVGEPVGSSGEVRVHPGPASRY